jgi:ATP-dependent helicase/nuclease subunit B
MTCEHFNERRWHALIEAIERLMVQRACHPSACVVLVPYAQLMAQARQAWVRRAGREGACYLPQIETTQNWARNLWAARGGYRAAEHDLREQAAFDQLSAAHWLDALGLSAQRDVLMAPLIEAAGSLARRAAAIAPTERAAWRERLTQELTAGLGAQALRHEASVAQLALAWAGSSSYETDILFEQQTTLLVVLEGWQADPLAQALMQRLGPHAVALPLALAQEPRGRIALQRAADRQDEAERAAACVLRHLQQGQEPVGLIAQDRLLTRRIAALLAGRGVAIRDETGWKLSTTRAAARLMALLRASAAGASCDEVLAWIKPLPGLDAGQLERAEAELRDARLRCWSDVGPACENAWALAARLRPWQQALRGVRPVAHWLEQLDRVLHECGMWDELAADVAGQAVFDALCLHDPQSLVGAQAQPPLSARAFTQWVAACLEAGTFSPVHPARAQVVVLPMAQLLGRCLAALVLPGADEVQMPAWPQPTGPWTARQRQLLGLPAAQELAASAHRAWLHALAHASVDVLWRQSDSGERRMASAWVQALMLEGAHEGEADGAADPRDLRAIDWAPQVMAQARGDGMPVERLSASAYDDLRNCPYRFFALRQLALAPVQEIEADIDRRDFGNWLHATLFAFHAQLQAEPAPSEQRRAQLFDLAAQQALLQTGMQRADFLPYEASVPALRQGYLQWLAAHEASGHRFVQAEQWLERNLDGVKLVGKIDRMDLDAQGSALLLDYKSESVEKTRERIKFADEDTQLAFYAALLGQEPVAAAYLNVGERGQTKVYTQDEVSLWRDRIVRAVQDDVSRLHSGEPLRALGQGRSCEHCKARGLCRRDFVQDAP